MFGSLPGGLRARRAGDRHPRNQRRPRRRERHQITPPAGTLTRNTQFRNDRGALVTIGSTPRQHAQHADRARLEVVGEADPPLAYP